MILERVEDDGLAHYSYLVGDHGAGRVAVVDPRRDLDVYTRLADERGAEITDVLETHIHADYCSGARELAELTGATFWASAYDAGERFEVVFPHRDLAHGEAVHVGRVRLEAVHTPGHTPEHLSYLVYDEERSSSEPLVLLSGDFLFIGGLGRPDLLGEEAVRGLAEKMYQSVRERLPPLPDGLEVRPAHGAGSMCGSGMSGRPVSTLGVERGTNRYLDPELDLDGFVRRLLADLPPRPPYYTRMKRVNSEGPARLEGVPAPPPLRVDRFRERVDAGDVVVDLRHPLAFGGGHVPGAFGIPDDRRLSQWAAWVVPYDTPLLLVHDSGAALDLAVRRLVRVGLDGVAGHLDGGMQAWLSAGEPVGRLEHIAVPELAERLSDDELRVLDVRTDEEWRAGHIERAVHLFAGELPGRLSQLPSGGTLALVCGSGYRSTVAASVLLRAGREDVLNVAGGMAAWNARGLPVTDGGSPARRGEA